jgi:PAS domain S-box-containing protein
LSTHQNGDFALGPDGNKDGAHSLRPIQPISAEILFAGGGELGWLMRQFDWSQTSLGPIEFWPQSLRTCVRIVLTSRQPMFVWWGDELINLYNDAYKSILGGKHPKALGRPARTVWAEIWDQVRPRAESAMRSNEGTYDESLMLIMERHGYREETYYTFSYSPVPNDEGGIGGILCANSDGTDRIVGERRVALLRELASRTANARTWREACRLSALGLGSDPQDICFALIYALGDLRDVLELAGNLRVDEGHTVAPPTMQLDQNAPWPVETAMRTHEIQLVNETNRQFADLPGGAWNEAPHTVAVVPLIASGGTGKSGVLIAGLNPYRLPDDNYLGFLNLVAGQISASIANAEAFEQERLRAEALAELDRAKTIFFSNVSHEFRTPLTLMLGPLEDLLADPDMKHRPGDAKQIETIHRNGLRLLRLVNTLLDFSRIESRRIQAVYRPVDLAARTADLASVFRSAMERAGLQYQIECDSLPEPVYVDLEMWEKIVLNLLSNAFKFTLEGKVDVRLQVAGGDAELRVSDTGAGIPDTEIPHIFERFHRIDGAPGRTHEGTGIGLALVDELVRLHGGTVQVDSKLGEGTAFTVKIPLGTAHLSSDRISVEGIVPATTVGASPFVQEAMRWLPDGAETSIAEGVEMQDLQSIPTIISNSQSERPRVLLADDNRDMREYVQRLLERRYNVTALSDGEQALAEALRNPPDLVLTDVMMPKLDGFQLLHELRHHEETAALPVIMLSARAGEEAESEGMEAGADDYLVKPFTGRELMARVGAHISMYRLRCELTQRERELRARAEEAECHYRTIVESIIEGFVFIDRDWRIRYANERWAEFAGMTLPELVGCDLWQSFPSLDDSEFGRLYRQVMHSGTVEQLEQFYEPLGRWFHVSIFPSPDGILIFSLDVTEKHMQHERLMLTEKLAATGRLAATIAHEINNPLESVLNLIYLSRTSLADADTIKQYLLTAEKEITRVSHIARHTLGFYRDTSKPILIDPEALLKEVLVVYESRLRAAGIEVQIHHSAKSEVKGLRGELHQVLSNLISNSIDAMPEPGTISIVIEDSHWDGTKGIDVAFSDTGKGIPSENIPHLFEPFFTTKPNAGTGLGLWVVKQFIDSWGGRISVESSIDRANRGTTFRLFIPLVALSNHPDTKTETAQTTS